MIEIKNIEVLKGLLLPEFHPRLVEVVEWVIGRWEKIFITCGYEARNYASVHSVIPVRGLDCRSSIYPDPKAVVKEINQHWAYDPARPEMAVAILHDTGRGMHIHLQATATTQERK